MENKKYNDLVVIYDMVKNMIKSYTLSKQEEQKRLDSNQDVNTCPPYTGDDLVSARIEEKILNINIFIKDLNKIKNKIIEIKNNNDETN